MIGVRDLRADLTAHVRRAAAGETTVVSIGGRPCAVLAPLAPPHAMSDEAPGEPHLSSLVAAGAVLPPRRTDGKLPSGTVGVWGTVRLDRLLAEIRG